MPQQRFYNATDKLVAAFLTDSISHCGCNRCAVGNVVGVGDWIVAHGGYGDIEEDEVADFVFIRTGYTIPEIYGVEKAFEQRSISRQIGIGECGLGDNNDHDGFIGLCHVFDYLVSIEDWKDEESKVNLVEMCLQ